MGTTGSTRFAYSRLCKIFFMDGYNRFNSLCLFTTLQNIFNGWVQQVQLALLIHDFAKYFSWMGTTGSTRFAYSRLCKTFLMDGYNRFNSLCLFTTLQNIFNGWVQQVQLALLIHDFAKHF